MAHEIKCEDEMEAIKAMAIFRSHHAKWKAGGPIQTLFSILGNQLRTFGFRFFRFFHFMPLAIPEVTRDSPFWMSTCSAQYSREQVQFLNENRDQDEDQEVNDESEENLLAILWIFSFQKHTARSRKNP